MNARRQQHEALCAEERERADGEIARLLGNGNQLFMRSATQLKSMQGIRLPNAALLPSPPNATHTHHAYNAPLSP
ncbi:hypothetical protein ACLKA7_002397 [Drosophila subpalustris]